MTPDPVPPPPTRSPGLSRLSQLGAAIIGVGLVPFLIGVFPDLVRVDFTSGLGLLQITALLFGIVVMTLGAYTYMYATRHRSRPRRLREDIGVRLMATGLVVAGTTGLADVIGIGTHFGQQRPFFGPVQAGGVALGVALIVAGILLYSRR